MAKRITAYSDLLAEKFGERDPTSLLVWTLKAKTVADPLGNEEQLMNRARKGALVDLRPGPHEVIQVMRGGRLQSFRKSGEVTSCERAFSEQGNFVVVPPATSLAIAGRRGQIAQRTYSWFQIEPFMKNVTSFDLRVDIHAAIRNKATVRAHECPRNDM